MKILVKSVLVLARKLNSENLLKTAYFLATNKSDALSCYYIACRYLMKSDTGFYVISDVLAKHDLSLTQMASPVLEGYHNEGLELNDIRKFKLRIDQEVQCHNINNFSLLLTYVDLFLSKDFRAAYEIWRKFDDVINCLAIFKASIANKNVSDKKIAVVLPGNSTIEFGNEIDSYSLVGRTGFYPPPEKNHKYSGSRFDYVFLNSDRYTELSQWDMKDISDFSPKVISNVSCRKIKVSGLKEEPILEIKNPINPITGYSFLALRIANWCVDKALLKPYFYNGDFYLNDKLYENDHYDSKKYLSHEKNVIDSYLLHDVFFVHACLSIYHQEGLIGAKGALENILKMSGTEFSEALAKRWS